MALPHGGGADPSLRAAEDIVGTGAKSGALARDDRRYGRSLVGSNGGLCRLNGGAGLGAFQKLDSVMTIVFAVYDPRPVDDLFLSARETHFHDFSHLQFNSDGDALFDLRQRPCFEN